MERSRILRRLLRRGYIYSGSIYYSNTNIFEYQSIRNVCSSLNQLWIKSSFLFLKDNKIPPYRSTYNYFNLRFSHGSLQQSLLTDSTDIISLNSETRIDNEALEKLIDAIEKRKKVVRILRLFSRLKKEGSRILISSKNMELIIKWLIEFHPVCLKNESSICTVLDPLITLYRHSLISVNYSSNFISTQVATKLFKILFKMLNKHPNSFFAQGYFFEMCRLLVLDGNKHIIALLSNLLHRDHSQPLTANLTRFLIELWINRYDNLLSDFFHKTISIDHLPWGILAANFNDFNKRQLIAAIQHHKSFKSIDNWIHLIKAWCLQGAIQEAENLFSFIYKSEFKKVNYYLATNNQNEFLEEWINLLREDKLDFLIVKLLLDFKPSIKQCFKLLNIVKFQFKGSLIEHNEMQTIVEAILNYHLYNLEATTLIGYELQLECYGLLNQMDGIEYIFKELKNRSMKIKPRTMLSLLTAFEKHSTISHYEKLFYKCAAMVTKVNIAHFTALIHRYGQFHSTLPKVMSLINHMTSSQDTYIDIVLYQTLIDCFIKQRHPSLLNQCLQALENEKINLDLRLYTTLIKHFGHLRRQNQVISLVKSIRSRELGLDYIFYTVSLKALQKCSIDHTQWQGLLISPAIKSYLNSPKDGYLIITYIINHLKTSSKGLEYFSYQLLDEFAILSDLSNYPYFLVIIEELALLWEEFNLDNLLNLFPYYYEFGKKLPHDEIFKFPCLNRILERYTKKRLSSTSNKLLV